MTNPFSFPSIFAVDPGDGLDQVVALDRLVDVHAVEKRHIKAGEPHVHHDGDLEVGFGGFELPIQFLAVLFGAQHIVQALLHHPCRGSSSFDAFHGHDLFSSPAPSVPPRRHRPSLRPIRDAGQSLPCRSHRRLSRLLLTNMALPSTVAPSSMRAS